MYFDSNARSHWLTLGHVDDFIQMFPCWSTFRKLLTDRWTLLLRVTRRLRLRKHRGSRETKPIFPSWAVIKFIVSLSLCVIVLWLATLQELSLSVSSLDGGVVSAGNKISEFHSQGNEFDIRLCRDSNICATFFSTKKLTRLPIRSVNKYQSKLGANLWCINILSRGSQRLSSA